MSSKEDRHRSHDGKRSGSSLSDESFAERKVRVRRETNGPDVAEEETAALDQEKLLAEVNRLRTTVQLQETQLELLSSRNSQGFTGESNRPNDERKYFTGRAAEQRTTISDIAITSKAALGQSSPHIFPQSREQPNALGNVGEVVDAQSKQIDMLQRLIQEERLLLSRQMDRDKAVGLLPSQQQRSTNDLEGQLHELSRQRADFHLGKDFPSNLLDSDPSFARLPGSGELEESKRRVEALKAMIRNEQLANLRLEEEQLLQQVVLQRRLQGDGRDMSQSSIGHRSLGIPFPSRPLLGTDGYTSLGRELALGRQPENTLGVGRLPENSLASELLRTSDLRLREQLAMRERPRLDSKPAAVPKKSNPQPVRRSPIPLALDEDEANLSKSQQLIRSALEFFQASKEDVIMNAQCRRNPIRLRQVGLRCKFCSAEFLHRRGRGSVYYPARIAKVYQAAQNIAMTHLLGTCVLIPEELREEIKKHRETRGKGKTSTGGRGYWVESCNRLGLIDNGEENGIWFTDTGYARSA